jgi:hypothetical protein
MSNITYNPENHSKLDEWIDSCPRELANLISIIAFQNKGDGTMNQMGVYSVLKTSRGEVLQMLEEAIDDLQNRRNELLGENDLYKAAHNLQRMLDRSEPPM